MQKLETHSRNPVQTFWSDELAFTVFVEKYATIAIYLMSEFLKVYCIFTLTYDNLSAYQRKYENHFTIRTRKDELKLK